MLKKPVILAAAFAIAASGTAFGQTDVTVKKNNDNVTKVDGTVAGAEVKGITNPAQSRVRVRDETLGRIDVRVKPGDSTALPDLSDLEVDVRELNDNVTKVDVTGDDIKAKGMTNPAQTRVKARGSDGSQVQVRVKPPKD